MLIALLTLSWASPPVLTELASLRQQRWAVDAPHLDASVYERALAGQVVAGIEFVDGVKAGKGWGVAVYDLPVRVVWKALNDDERRARFTSLSASQVVEGAPFVTGRKTFQFMPLPVVADRWWMVLQEHNAALYTASDGRMWEMVWRDALDPDLAARQVGALASSGLPVAWTRGAWLLTSLPDARTLVEYYTWSDPGGALPAGAASRFAAGAVRKLLADIEAMARDAATRPDEGFVRPDQTPL